VKMRLKKCNGAYIHFHSGLMKGFLIHQIKTFFEPELLKWILKPDYFDQTNYPEYLLQNDR